jgi:hypothetical protein
MHHDIDLTKKGEAYAHRHAGRPEINDNIQDKSPAARHPGGCPDDVSPAVWRDELSTRVESHLAIVSGLLALLDDMEGDWDLEPSYGFDALEGGDIQDEPHDDLADGRDLSWPEGLNGPQRLMHTLGTDEDEDSDIDEDSDVGEDSDPAEDSDPGEAEPDHEDSLGWVTAHEDGSQGYGALTAGATGDMEADYCATDRFGATRCFTSDEEDNLGSPALELPDGTVVNDREATECGNGVCDDHGCGTENDVYAY